MSGVGNYCRTDSAVPQSAAGAGPRSSTAWGSDEGGGHGGGGGWGDTIGGGGGGGVVARTREHIYCNFGSLFQVFIDSNPKP